jgi:outer membrane murein-binding lipoprotein Lpp
MRRESNELHGSCRSHGTWAPLALTALLLAGCGIGSARKDPLELKVETLQREKAELAGRVEQCQIEGEQLKQQVKAMAALPKDGRQNPYKLTCVRFARFTGFYDSDKDGKRERLLVYIQPMDADGDIIKAAGIVQVQLWNLNDSANQALLGEWQIRPAELRKLWISALVSDYRLPFDVSLTPELLAQPLTVKIVFTDYLTGEIFHDQMVIEPRPQ